MKLDMNAACLADPAVIVQPTTAYEVSRALQYAADMSLQVSVRGGGHSYTCNSVKNNSMQIDMRQINNIELRSESTIPTGHKFIEYSNTTVCATWT